MSPYATIPTSLLYLEQIFVLSLVCLFCVQIGAKRHENNKLVAKVY